MLVVVEVVVADEVVEVVGAVEEKGRRPKTAHIAEWTTIQPKTVGSTRKSKTNNTNHINVHEMPAVMIMLLSAIIVVNPVICAMNAN
jgi:hypothetical protein